MAARAFTVLVSVSASASNPHSSSKKSAALPSLSLPSIPKNPRIVLTTSFIGDPFPLSSRPPPPLHSRRYLPDSMTAVLSMLPTANPERASTESFSKWSARAIKFFGMGELEARKLKYSTTGTEALLMGILVEGTSQAAKYLRANGVTLFKVRDETVKLLGKSDMYFFSPEHPPLTEPAQKALDWAVDEKLKSGDSGEVTTSHMLLGIWAQEDSASHKILASLGFDSDKANELSKSANVDAVMNYR